MAFALGNGHSLMVKQPGGSLWVAGSNAFGQLGLGAIGGKKSSFEQVIKDGVEAVAAGDSYSMVLMQDGTVLSAGKNDVGQLGLGSSFGSKVVSFTQVRGIKGAAKLVAAGGSHSMVVTNDGKLWATGNNKYGQNGFGGYGRSRRDDFTEVTRVTDDVIAIALGNSHSILLLKEGGTVWASGNNDKGQLGLGSTEGHYNSFKQVTSLAQLVVTAVAAGGSHSLALAQDGTLWVTGDASSGQLGTGSTSQRKSFTKVESVEKFKAVSAGSAYSLALSTKGGLLVAGSNVKGQLGDGSMETSKNFKLVGGVGALEAVYAGGRHSAIVKQDGKAYVAGENVDGQLGLGLSGLSSSKTFAMIPGDQYTAYYVTMLLLLNHSLSDPDICLHNESGFEGCFSPPAAPTCVCDPCFTNSTRLYCSHASHLRGQH